MRFEDGLGLLADLDEVRCARLGHGAVQRVGGRGDADQDQHDQAHALLPVVAAMRERDAGAGQDEQAANPPRRRRRALRLRVERGNAHEQLHRHQEQGGEHESDERAEEQRLAFGEVRSHVGLVHVGDLQVRHGEEDHVRLLDGLGRVVHLQPFLLGDGARGASGIKPDDHPHPAVLEVERVGVALGAEADDRAGLGGEQGEVGVFVGVNFGGHGGKNAECRMQNAKVRGWKWRWLNGKNQAARRISF